MVSFHTNLHLRQLLHRLRMSHEDDVKRLILAVKTNLVPSVEPPKMTSEKNDDETQESFSWPKNNHKRQICIYLPDGIHSIANSNNAMEQTKNTIRDGGSTTLYTATLFDLFLQFVCTVQTAYNA